MVVDALVGLMILATILGLAFGAVGAARDLAARAAETRRASALLRFLAESSPGAMGAAQGVDADFRWRLIVTPEASAPFGGVSVCSRQAVAYSPRSRRSYSLATQEICRPKDAR